MNSPFILVDPHGLDGGFAHDRQQVITTSSGGGGHPNPFATLGSLFAPIVQPVVNAWNSLPPEARTVITIAASAAIIIGTGGAAAPLILGIGLAAGAGAMGIYAAHQVLTGQAITGLEASEAQPLGRLK